MEPQYDSVPRAYFAFSSSKNRRKMKAKESETPEGKLQAPSFKHRSTNKFSCHPDSGIKTCPFVIKQYAYPCYMYLYMQTSRPLSSVSGSFFVFPLQKYTSTYHYKTPMENIQTSYRGREKEVKGKGRE